MKLNVFFQRRTILLVLITHNSTALIARYRVWHSRRVW